MLFPQYYHTQTYILLYKYTHTRTHVYTNILYSCISFCLCSTFKICFLQISTFCIYVLNNRFRHCYCIILFVIRRELSGFGNSCPGYLYNTVFSVNLTRCEHTCTKAEVHVHRQTSVCVIVCAGSALSQLDQLLPIGARAQFYRPCCKLTSNLGRPKLFPFGPRTS